MSLKIPYVISESHPDYKRPYLFEDFGAVDENMIDTFFVEKVAEFITERCNIDEINQVEDISKFWESYYDEYYMDNAPWDARIFINGKWINVHPTDVQIFDCINRIKSGEKNDNIENEKHENYFEEDLLEWKLTDEEEEIQEEMKKYMESELDKSDLELMSTMNSTEQIIYLLNKCLLNISSEKYKSNQDLFYKFLNIILRFTEKDIAVTTEEMTKNHDEKISLKLNYLMNIYGSLLEYKTIYNSLQR